MKIRHQNYLYVKVQNNEIGIPVQFLGESLANQVVNYLIHLRFYKTYVHSGLQH